MTKNVIGLFAVFMLFSLNSYAEKGHDASIEVHSFEFGNHSKKINNTIKTRSTTQADNDHKGWADILSFGSGGNRPDISKSKKTGKAKYNSLKKELLIKQNGKVKKAKPGTYKLKNGKVVVVNKRGVAKYK